MVSEAILGAIRVGSNYARQLISLALSLILVPIFFSWLGKDGYGLIMLITAAAGLASMIEDVVRGSLIRELAAAHHTGDRTEFRRIYDSSWIVSAVAAVICVISFIATILCLPLFTIKAELREAAYLMLLLEGAFTTALVLAMPALNMLQVREWFILENFWQLLRRGAQFSVAVVLYKTVDFESVGDAVIAYYAGFTLFNFLLLGLALGLIVWKLPECRPRPWRASRTGLRSIWSTFGWYSGVNVSINLAERVPALLINFFFGLHGNAVFGIALVLASYIRTITFGVNTGLEAVAARVAHVAAPDSLRRVVRAYTMLHAAVAMPAAAFLLTFGEEIVRVWIGARTDEPETLLPDVNLMLPLLVVPVLVRAVSECWVRMLYGAGMVRLFAPTLMWATFVNPVLGLLAIYTLPQDLKLHGPVIGMLITTTVFQFVLLPLVAGRGVGMGFTKLLRPVVRPMLASVLAVPPAWLAAYLIVAPATSTLAVAAVIYGAAYASGVLVLTPPAERRSMLCRLRQVHVRMRRGRRSSSEPAEPLAPVEIGPISSRSG